MNRIFTVSIETILALALSLISLQGTLNLKDAALQRSPWKLHLHITAMALHSFTGKSCNHFTQACNTARYLQEEVHWKALNIPTPSISDQKMWRKLGTLIL